MYADSTPLCPRHTWLCLGGPLDTYRNLTKHLRTCQCTPACSVRASLVTKSLTLYNACPLPVRSRIREIHLVLEDFSDKFFRISQQFLTLMTTDDNLCLKLATCYLTCPAVAKYRFGFLLFGMAIKQNNYILFSPLVFHFWSML